MTRRRTSASFSRSTRRRWDEAALVRSLRVTSFFERARRRPDIVDFPRLDLQTSLKMCQAALDKLDYREHWREQERVARSRSETAWKAFTVWCSDRGVPPSSDLHTIHAYSRDLRDRGSAPAVVTRTLRRLGPALEERGLSNPPKIGRGAPAPQEARLQAPRKTKFRSPSSGPGAGSHPRSLVLTRASAPVASIELLAQVPEEEIWLEGQRSEQTRRAYKADIRHLVRTLRVRSRDEIRMIDRAAIIHWQRA